MCWAASGLWAQGSQCIFQNGRYVQPDGSPCNNTIVTAVPFLRITPDARFGAMGDVGIAMSADPNSMNFNNSMLAFADKDFAVSATYTPWLRALGLNDVYLAYLSAYKRIDDMQTIGFGLRYFSLGQIQYTNEQGQPLQTVRPNEFELTTAYSRKLGENFSAGLGVKLIYSNLGTGAEINGELMTPAVAFASDFSFTYKDDITINGQKATVAAGLSATNLGSKISYTQSANRDYLPSNLGIGSSLQYNFDDYNSLTFAMDINKLLVPTPTSAANPEHDTDNNDIPDYKELSVPAAVFSSFGDAPNGFTEELQELMWSFGLEYWYNKQFAVRAGYYTEHRLKGNRRYLTLGMGLKYNVMGINFSYLVPTNNVRNPLDNTLRFSLIFDFGEFN